MSFGYFLDERQSESISVDLPIDNIPGPVKRFKNVFEIRRRNADAAVGNRKFDRPVTAVDLYAAIGNRCCI